MPGGGGSAFSQMMRAQMGGNDPSVGLRKLDSQDKRNYKEMGNTQAAAAKDKVQAVNEKAKARNTASARQNNKGGSDDGGFVANWRTGNFGGPAPSQSAANLAMPAVDEQYPE